MAVRQWAWLADINHDGLVTISDVPHWIGWLFFYPGDLAIYAIVGAYPGFAQLFELTPASYGGAFSFFASVLAWGAVCIGLGRGLRHLKHSGEDHE